MTIDDIIEYLKTNLHETDITLRLGADEELIKQFESRLNIKLPEDIKQFYKFSDGFESDEHIFNIVSLAEIIQYKLEESTFYLAEYLVYSETWELEINSENNKEYATFNVNGYGNKILITNSLAGFLTRFLSGGLFGEDGLYKWGEELRLKNSTSN